MGVVVRIGIAALVRSRLGSVALPEEITLYCPRCGTPCCDKGQCKLSIDKFVDCEKKIMEARLAVDCRVCGCYGESPKADF